VGEKPDRRFFMPTSDHGLHAAPVRFRPPGTIGRRHPLRRAAPTRCDRPQAGREYRAHCISSDGEWFPRRLHGPGIFLPDNQNKGQRMVFDLIAVAKDIRLEVYVDPVMYMALRHRADREDRTVSQHVRNLIRVDLERASAEMAERGRGERGVAEGEAA